MAPPFGRRRLDTRVSKGTAPRGLEVQGGFSSSEGVERVGGVADSGGAGAA